MARTTGQKRKLLILQRILETRSDEEHPLTVGELIAALEAEGISAERKSIYDDMTELAGLGVDVQSRKGKTPGWFIGERTFQLAELKLLVDAVQSCKFITRKKSDQLIAKLEGLTSVYQAKALRRQVYVAGRVKTMNESVYYSIDTLHTAIAGNRTVGFQYFEYNVRKERVYRRDGAVYEVSPYGLIWDSENYYLAGYDHLHGEMRNYRVDKMAGLEVIDRPRQGFGSGEAFDIAVWARKHFGMFHGREGKVCLRCESRMVGVVLDRFGGEAILVPDGAEHFTVTVEAVMSPQFLGWVFGLEDAVEVVSPAWAREEFRSSLARVEGVYRS